MVKRLFLFPICWIIAMLSFAIASAHPDEECHEHNDTSRPCSISNVKSITFESEYDFWRLNGNITYDLKLQEYTHALDLWQGQEYIGIDTSYAKHKVAIGGGLHDIGGVKVTFRNPESNKISFNPRDGSNFRQSGVRLQEDFHFESNKELITNDYVGHRNWYYDNRRQGYWDFSGLRLNRYQTYQEAFSDPLPGNFYDSAKKDPVLLSHILIAARMGCDKSTLTLVWNKEASRIKVEFNDDTTKIMYFVDNDAVTSEGGDGGYTLCHRDSGDTINIGNPSANIQPVQQGTQSRGNDDHGTSTDPSNRQEDVGNKPTQTTPPANDSDKIAALQQNIVDLQADVVSLNELVDKLLKENAALRHDNAVLSTLIDANQSNIIVVDEVVSEEATEVSQGTTETVSTPQVETSVTVSVDISGYEFVDIAPDGRPRIISTVDVQIHPDTRKRFLSEWGKFYDEHRDIEWWDCAGWSPYESPPVAVPVSEINANPHNHCDLRKP